MFEGEKEKIYKGKIVPLIYGKGIAIGVEYETGIAKIGNQVKAIISTQLWNFWGGFKVASRKFMLAKFIIEKSN